MDPEARIHGSGGWDAWIRAGGRAGAGIHGSRGRDPRIRRLGPMDPEAGIHGSGGSDPWIRRLGSWIRRLGSMDPEAGIHGSGGWDPWIRRLGPMDPEAGIHGSEPPKPASAGLGRPAGGRGPEVQKERKIVKSSRKCSHFTYPRPDAYTAPALGTLFGARSAHLREKCVLRTFPTFSTFGRFEAGK